jgi:hypothetical protein
MRTYLVVYEFNNLNALVQIRLGLGILRKGPTVVDHE